jgi:hypothetical protein
MILMSCWGFWRAYQAIKTLAMVAKYAHANGEHIQAATDKLERRYQHTGG